MLLLVPGLAAAARVALGAIAAAVVLASSSLEATERACPIPRAQVKAKRKLQPAFCLLTGAQRLTESDYSNRFKKSISFIILREWS